MKSKLIYYSSMVLNWIVGLIGLYLGFIIFLIGPMATSRGDIDYPDFSDADKRIANMEAWGIRLVGLIIFVVSIFWLVYFKKIAEIVSTKKQTSK